MLKQEIVNKLLTFPKYKGQSSYFLMKNKKDQLIKMLDSASDYKEEVKEEKIKVKLSLEEEKELLTNDLIIVKKKFFEVSPKEMSKFDWDNYGDNGSLKVFLKQWRVKLKNKGVSISDLDLKYQFD